jgi:hypothetical protein
VLKEFRLTTKDNEFDPFNDYVHWDDRDKELGYSTSQYIASIARTSDSMSLKEYNDEVERAIDEIMHYNLLDAPYIKVSREIDDEDLYIYPKNS